MATNSTNFATETDEVRDFSYQSRRQKLVRSIENKLQINITAEDIDDGAMHFQIDLSKIRLQGMNQTHFLLIDNHTQVIPAIKKFWKKENTLGNRLIILSYTEEAYNQARNNLAFGHLLLLSPRQIDSLLNTNNSYAVLKQYLWQQIPKERLIPFDILHPVTRSMFFGRQSELNRLLYEREVGFAITGPSRIGKTSLVKQYMYRSIREKNPRSVRQFYINCYGCKSKTDDDVARHIAMEIESSNRGNRVRVDNLATFIKYQHKKLEGTLELLIDEVDEICHGSVFDALGTAARDRHCRLVLCGRGVLLKMLLKKEFSLASRLELIRPMPLGREEACNLLLKPLEDLGLTVIKPNVLTDKVMRLTGRLPHLIQFYGKKLALECINEKLSTVSTDDVDRIAESFETVQYFISPLNDLESHTANFVARLILKECPEQLSAQRVQAPTYKEGIHLDYKSIMDVYNDLVINNVLSWNGEGKFSIANESLPRYAENLGLLGSGLLEARRRLKSHT